MENNKENKLDDELYFCPICGCLEGKKHIDKFSEDGFCPICKTELIPSGYDNKVLIKIGKLKQEDLYNPPARYKVFFEEVIKTNPKFNPEKHKEYLQYRNSPERKLKAEIQFQKIKQELIQEREEANKVRCPRCGSTQIQMVQRKWSLLTGIFTNKVDRVCVKCKYRW